MSSEHSYHSSVLDFSRHHHDQSPTPPPLTAIQESHLDSVPSSSGSILPVESEVSPTTLNTTFGSAPIITDSREPLRETFASPVSSPSLMKIINETNISPGSIPSKRKRASSPSPDIDIPILHRIRDKGKGKAKAVSLSPTPPPQTQITNTSTANTLKTEPLSEYTCPICFFPPSNATCTPCGHVCCGSCLFTAVKTTLQRGAGMGMPAGAGENTARCPVCRAIIPGWDGRGGGVIGLKLRQVISL